MAEAPGFDPNKLQTLIDAGGATGAGTPGALEKVNELLRRRGIDVEEQEEEESEFRTLEFGGTDVTPIDLDQGAPVRAFPEFEPSIIDPPGVQQAMDRASNRLIERFGPLAVEAAKTAPERAVGGGAAMRAAEVGVDPTTPVENGHMLASFAFDQAAELEAYQQENPNKIFRVGEDTKDIEWFNADKFKWALANPPAMKGTFGRMVGPAMVLAPEAVAGVGVAILRKNPVSAAAAAGVTAGIAEYVRLAIGRNEGINTKMTDAQMEFQALKVAGLSLGTGVLADKVIRAGKWLMDVGSGKVFNRAAVDDLFQGNTEEAAKIAEDFNARFQGANLRFNLAQASDNEDLKIIAAFLKGSGTHRSEFLKFEAEQRESLNTIYDLINKRFERELSTTEAEQQVNSVFRQMLDERAAPAEQAVHDAAANIDRALVEGVTIQFKEATAPVRRMADIKAKALDRWAGLIREKLETLTGNKEFIRNKVGKEGDDLFTFMKGLKREEQEALIPAQRRELQSVLPQEGQAVTLGPEASPALLAQEARGELDESVLEAVKPKLLDPNAKFTYRELHQLSSFLKRRAREADKGQTTDVDSALYKRFAGAVDRSIERDLGAIGDPDAPGRTLSTVYHRFKQKYAERMELINRGVIGDIIQKDGTRYKVTNRQAFEDMVADDETMEQVLQLIGKSPNTKRQFQEGFQDFYRQKVGLDFGGQINMDQHRQFMDKYGDMIVQLYGRENKDFIRTVGGMGRALEGLQNQRDDVLKQINSSFDANFRDLNAGRLTSMIWNNKNPEASRRMVEVLKKNQAGREALDGMRNEVLKKIDQQIMRHVKGSGGSKEFSHTKLNDMLFGKGTRDDTGFLQVLKNVMPESYVDDLVQLNRAIQIASRETGAANFSNTAFWTDTVKGLARAYVGLFTRPGRIITAADRVRQRMAKDALAKAIMNPADLRTLMSLRGVSTRTSKAAHFLGSMGAGAWHVADDE